MSEKQQQPSSNRFVNAAFICRELGISPRTLNNWIDRGLFPRPLRLGLRRRVWLRATFENVIQEAAEAAKE